MKSLKILLFCLVCLFGVQFNGNTLSELITREKTKQAANAYDWAIGYRHLAVLLQHFQAEFKYLESAVDTGLSVESTYTIGGGVCRHLAATLQLMLTCINIEAYIVLLDEYNHAVCVFREPYTDTWRMVDNTDLREEMGGSIQHLIYSTYPDSTCTYSLWRSDDFFSAAIYRYREDGYKEIRYT